jgi:hypothetical protein
MEHQKLSVKMTNEKWVCCMWEDVRQMINMTFMLEEHVQSDDSLPSCAVQEVGNLWTEDKTTETDDEEGEAGCKHISKCSEAFQCMNIYHCFHVDIPDMPESIFHNVW